LKKLYHFYSRLLYTARRWIYFITGLAFLWAVVGAWSSITFPGLWPIFLDYLQKTFEDILGDIGSQSHLQLALGLFKQNAAASAYDLFFGLGLGLLPVFSIVLNFFAVGFLAGPYLTPSLFPQIPGTFGLFALSIIPHGIFELPALLLATAFGLRLGWLWLLPSSSGQRGRVLKKTVLENLAIAPLIVVLLALAAFVESFVTTWLVQ